MFGNVVKHTLGLRARRRDEERDGGTQLPVVKLPLARIPEKRSDTVDLGNLREGRLHLIVGGSASGLPVNETTSLSVAAVTACVSLLADMVAKLPVLLYRDTKTGPKEITNHPAIKLIGGMPSELHTSFELRQLMETGKGLGGNGYARVYRDEFFQPRAIQWIAPADVEPRIIRRTNGEAFVSYKVNGMGDNLTRADIIHVRGTVSKDGFTGISPIHLLRENIGTALSQTVAAGKLMRNGAKWPGYITVEGISNTPQGKEQLEKIRDEINQNMAGVMNNGRIPVVGGNMTFHQTNGMSMVDAQFLESRRFELQEIARLYRIPAFLIGDTTSSTTWGSGIEQQTLGFLNFCLDPHLVGWEQSLAHTLLTVEEVAAGYYFRFDRDQLANVALEARANFLQTMRNIGAFSPNDVRRELGYSVIPAEDGGDDYGRPFNASGGTPAKDPAPEPAPAPTP